MLPELIFLIGIPGSGKSKWIKEHKPDTYIVVCPDQIRYKLTGNISDQSVNVEVFEIAYEKIISALKNNISVVLDAINLNEQFRNELISLIPPCRLKAIVFEVEPAVAYERIRAALLKGENRSKVPEYLVYSSYGLLLYTKTKLESEGFEVEYFR